MLGVLIRGLVVLGMGWWLYKVVYSVFFSPLRCIPGPFILQLFPAYEMLMTQGGLWAWQEREYHRRYGRTFRKGWNTVLLASEDALREIHASSSFLKSDHFLATQVMGENIFSTINPEFHRKRKRIMAQAFSIPEVEALDQVVRTNVVDVATEILETHAAQGAAVDMFRMFGNISLDMIGVVGFGKSFETLVTGSHAAEEWFGDVLVRIYLSLFLPFVQSFPNPSKQKLLKLGEDAIQSVKRAPLGKSISLALINAKDPQTGDRLTDKELAEEAVLQIMAGLESTTSTMTWVLHLLLSHPDFLQDVIDELITRFPSRDAVITMEDCRAGCLPYLDAAIKETMRVMPTAPGCFERVVPKGGRVLHGYFLPAGTRVGVNTLTLHTLPEVWGKDAHIFTPRRWINMTKVPSAYAPFSIGARACIGKHLAMAEIRLTLATLLRKFHFHPLSNVPLTPYSLLFNIPKESKMHVHVTARTY
ncbi:hypothetical protein DSO57_1010491 [Entomophthora muscae]|uniref:Uncharacterized protein n=1 Tax=Entomophthora muscae TaxID=34485 RepID=A0ACC2SJB4_9FUNG|nr:hypothetical protein DSO57_1010491 [Entomophthora muscae]